MKSFTQFNESTSSKQNILAMLENNIGREGEPFINGSGKANKDYIFLGWPEKARYAWVLNKSRGLFQLLEYDTDNGQVNSMSVAKQALPYLTKAMKSL